MKWVPIPNFPEKYQFKNYYAIRNPNSNPELFFFPISISRYACTRATNVLINCKRAKNSASHFSDIIYNQQDQNFTQLLVPLMSLSETSIRFWVEPFEPCCKDDLRLSSCQFASFLVKEINCFGNRIDFSYSRINVTEKFDCPICANTIYGAQFVNPNKRHLVLIEGSTMGVYEMGVISKNVLRSNVCPVKFRRWEEEHDAELFQYAKSINYQEKINMAKVKTPLSNAFFSFPFRLLKKEDGVAENNCPENVKENICQVKIRLVNAN